MKKTTLIIIGMIIALIALAVGAVKLLGGIISGAFNLVLGVVVVVALIIIVAWMFLYAAKQNKK